MFYVLDENNNKVEAYDKEGVLAAIEKAIADGSLADLVADAAFVTKLRCCVSGQTNRIAFVKEAQYNEMVANGTVESNVYYYITDDSTLDNVTELLNSVATDVDVLNRDVTDIKYGATSVGKAVIASTADKAKQLVCKSVMYVGTTTNEITERGLYFIDAIVSASTYGDVRQIIQFQLFVDDLSKTKKMYWKDNELFSYDGTTCKISATSGVVKGFSSIYYIPATIG